VTICNLISTRSSHLTPCAVQTITPFSVHSSPPPVTTPLIIHFLITLFSQPVSGCQLLHFTPANFYTSHLPIITLRTCQLLHFTPANYYTSHLQIVTLHTCQLLHFTHANYYTSNLPIITLHTYQLLHFTPANYYTSNLPSHTQPINQVQVVLLKRPADLT
jgi:hypothetical protein